MTAKDEAPPRLLKFLGRPSDLPPNARIKHHLLGHPLPFDRHDWTIVRSDGDRCVFGSKSRTYNKEFGVFLRQNFISIYPRHRPRQERLMFIDTIISAWENIGGSFWIEKEKELFPLSTQGASRSVVTKKLYRRVQDIFCHEYTNVFVMDAAAGAVYYAASAGIEDAKIAADDYTKDATNATTNGTNATTTTTAENADENAEDVAKDAVKDAVKDATVKDTVKDTTVDDDVDVNDVVGSICNATVEDAIKDGTVTAVTATIEDGDDNDVVGATKDDATNVRRGSQPAFWQNTMMGGDKRFSGEQEEICNLLFGESKRMFSVRENIRVFEWTRKEAECLFEGIKALKEEQKKGLGSIFISEINQDRLSEEEQDLCKEKSMKYYAVHDGQQRLLTLLLCLAALRDVFANIEDDKGNKSLDVNQNDLQEIRAITGEIEQALAPRRKRIHSGKPRLPRIAVSPADFPVANEIFSQGLFAKADGIVEPPPNKKSRQDLPRVSQAMKDVYEFFVEKFQGMMKETFDAEINLGSIYDFYANLKDKVSVLVATFTDEREAFDFVMNQQRGINIEPVDHFRYLICRNPDANDSEEEKAITAKSWDDLCHETSRKLVHEACLMVAQYATNTILRSFDDHKEEVGLFERFVKESLKERQQGSTIFERILRPALNELDCFRKLAFSTCAVNENAQLVPSIRFLSACSDKSTGATGTELEIVAVASLLVLKDPAFLLEFLKKLEKIALWMILRKPKPGVRQERISRILKELKNCNTRTDTPGVSVEEDAEKVPNAPLRLSSEESKQVLKALDNFVVKGGVSKTFAKILLERLNLQEMLADQGGIVVNKVYLERILPEDGSEEASKDNCRLGHFVVNAERPLRQRSSVAQMKLRWKQSPFPFTKIIGSEEEPSSQTIKKNHERVVDAAVDLWGLNNGNYATKAANGN